MMKIKIKENRINTILLIVVAVVLIAYTYFQVKYGVIN